MADICKCELCGQVFHSGVDADSDILDREDGNWQTCRSNAHWKLVFHVKQAHPDHGFHCPRRHEGSVFRTDDFKDFWSRRDGWRACSYCGSMHPDDLFAAMTAGHMITGTDKNYKIYCDVPNEEAGRRVSIGGESGPAFDRDGNPTRSDLTEDEKRKGSYERPLYGIAGATKTLKFYFQHLSAAEQDRFIELYNAKKINLEPRFGLYRTPYFARSAQ